MPVDSETTMTISCDNPACPGNSLDPADRLGWLFVSHEVYGEPTGSNVYCCAGCVSAAAAAVEAGDGTVGWAGEAIEPPVQQEETPA